MTLSCRRQNSTESYISVETNADRKPRKMLTWHKYLLIGSGVILGIALLIFLLVFVVFPIVFKNSLALQRFFMFINIQDPKEPDFDNPEKYGIVGVDNFYITVKDLTDGSLVSIGAWGILPEPLKDSKRTFNDTLTDSEYPVLMYNHGVGCSRIKPMATYHVLRKHFIMIAIDYRDFGDSTGADLSEAAVVDDVVQVYKWVRSKTSAEIFVWGHSLGTAISTHTVKALKSENIVPMGLVLESPFTTMREEVPSNSLGKVFSWLAYFEATVLNPLEENGFMFRTSTNILSVDCPIMIMHAEDDNVIPYRLGKKLYETARDNRLPSQGNVTYHQFEASLGYQHLDITSDPRIPQYVEEFIAVCRQYNYGKG